MLGTGRVLGREVWMKRTVAQKLCSRRNICLGQQAMAEYQDELRLMQEKTARLRVLRLACDAANQKALPANQKGVPESV